jgi:predicted PurR-regulated permease PerM
MTDEIPPKSSSSSPDWHRLHLWQIQPVRDAVMVFMGLGLLYLGKVLSIITVPLLVALGFAYLVEPIIDWLTRKAPWMGRKVAVLLMMGIIGLGRIGSTVATLALGLGMKVIANNRSPKTMDGVEMVSKEELFKSKC